jgi:hypothetical protein
MFDSGTDQAARPLLQAAAASIPPGTDLLAGFRTRHARASRRRVRARIALSLATAAALAGGIFAAVTASVVQAPSAYAAVAAAATRTSAQSFRASVTFSLEGGYQETETGVFNPAKQLGLATGTGLQILYGSGQISAITEYGRGTGAQIRFVDGTAYASVSAPDRAEYKGKAWIGIRDLLGAKAGLVAIPSPQSMFGTVRASDHVRYAGPASGPGWTGSRYTFSDFGASCSVSVDRQGRVRVFETSGGGTRLRITFADFGVPVAVSAPPASAVDWMSPS